MPATRSIPAGEACRKFLHMTPGVLPFVLAAVDHPDPLDGVSLAVVATICVVLTAVFLALTRIVRRPDEDNYLSTVLSYPACVLAVLVLFPARAEFAAVVVVVLAFGDGAASIGGRLFGKTRLPWNPEKSWAGTLAFLACAAPLASLAYWLEARPAVAPGVALACGIAAAAAGAVAESLPTRITDNARVGVAAALAVSVCGLLLA